MKFSFGGGFNWMVVTVCFFCCYIEGVCERKINKKKYLENLGHGCVASFHDGNTWSEYQMKF